MIYEKQLAQRLLKKFNTRDVEKIARELKIIVLFENLGTINGFYNMKYRQKFIHINENLNDWEMNFTLAHELGHAIIHPKKCTPFLKKHTAWGNKFENEASRFAVHFLISDEDIADVDHFSLEQMATFFGCSVALMSMRLKDFEK